MANMSLKKTPMPTQEPSVRAHNFDEVALGDTQKMAVEEADRCLGCKNPACVAGCPVGIDIPGFIQKVKVGEFEKPIASSPNQAPCLLFAVAFARKRTNARANVFAV
jgi:glutamate synthase (NADPH/NADH) small chain